MPSRRIRVSIEGTYEEVSCVRQILPIAARDLAFPKTTLLRLEICLTEALHNVIRHGYAGREGGAVEVDFLAYPDRLVIEIADEGAPIPPAARAGLRNRAPLPERDEDVASLPEGGFGIPILRAVLDEIDYRTGGGRNVLTMTKRTVLSPSDSALP
jgi:anti-sigma regulatory factor (Ser/Thr protein kinase)